jgi:hypothetical protein
MIALLNYFGITPNQLGPVVIVVAIYAWAEWKFVLKDIKYEIRDIKSEVTDLHHATKEIQKYIEDRDDEWTPQHGLGANPVFSNFGQANSPAIPNAKGTQLLKESNFLEQYPKFKPDLFVVMDAMGLRTLYDYERGAKRALRQMQDDPRFDPIKEYSVNHPDVSLSVIFAIAAWMIRDDYAKHKEGESGLANK